VSSTKPSRLQVPSKAVCIEQLGRVSQELVFIPRGKGIFVPLPELRQLAGIAKGAGKDGFRDRNDRY
jgi:hypothetical protein